MSTYRIAYSDELYHHGVKGMKWGHRKAQYYEAKHDQRVIRKETRGARISGSPAEMYKAKKRYADATARTVLAKGRLERETTTNAKRADAREKKSYIKALKKHGVSGSLNDARDGKGTAIYNAIKKEKGKKYAEEIQQKADRSLRSQAVTSAIAMGATIAIGMFLKDNIEIG